ncbi:unnamed protein product [Amaranthus hypochondriacus]
MEDCVFEAGNRLFYMFYIYSSRTLIE